MQHSYVMLVLKVIFQIKVAAVNCSCLAALLSQYIFKRKFFQSVQELICYGGGL